MKKSLSQMKHKINQAGSMMVEAMAMLALISLVTPTLYKKSAERTTELQDINTATHVRTVLKAIDNYVKINYQKLIAPSGSLNADGKIAKIEDITAAEYKAYFPYGYEFENLKNFGKPKAALRRQGDSITAFVEFPSSYDLGEMRAARIASIVGSNGGYVNKDKTANGVGGIWSLAAKDLTDLGFNGEKTSIVAASSEAINSATTSAMENEKYLQRTKVESNDQLWRNTMTTNLYMGNPKGTGERYKILGVDQMIVGSIETTTNGESLVLTEQATGGGSAWLAGTFSALKNNFTLKGNSATTYSMLFGSSENNYTVKALAGDAVSFNNGQIIFDQVNPSSTEEIGAVFKVNSKIEKNLEVQGSTRVATNTGSEFKAGPNGGYISATAAEVNLLNGNVKTTTQGNTKKTTIATDLQVDGKTKIGTGTKTPLNTQISSNLQLNVQGNAYVSGTLEAEEIDTKKFKVLELHAGRNDFTQNTYWLNATKDGVTITDPQNNSTRFSAGRDATKIFAPSGNNAQDSALILDQKSELRSKMGLDIYTTTTQETVSLQKNALRVGGGQGKSADVDIDAKQTLLNGGKFNVHAGDYGNVSNSAFYVDPKASNTDAGIGLVQMNAGVTRVAPRNRGVFEVVENTATTGAENFTNATGNRILRVSAKNFPEAGAGKGTRGAAELDLTRFRLWDNEGGAETQSILTVQLDSDSTGNQDKHNQKDSKSSIYIRRGAIEIEPTAGTGAKADENWGYIEASRFVANNPSDANNPSNGSVITPKFTGDYNSSEYANEYVPYDRYMVNPAYTSVMHDIKLTTRGGARLSDLLPDFINKGIYVVNNTYKENGKGFNDLQIQNQNNKLIISGLQEASSSGSNMKDAWASPFMGVVPAPQCPPGHARVITITPASFLMAQSGQMNVQDVASLGKRLYVNSQAQWSRLVGSSYNHSDLEQNKTVTGAQAMSENVNGHNIYYLGFGTDSVGSYSSSDLNNMPQPLYFQQSTWLKSAVYPYEIGKNGPCNSTLGSDKGCSGAFAGWVTLMGFIYPSVEYNGILKILNNTTSTDNNVVYWNLFPIRHSSLEAYATVYCYFDRTNIFGTTFESDMVDTNYDQLKKFRTDRKKNNEAYIKRLDDPTLKYKSPW